MKLPLLLEEERAVHHIQQAPESSILFHIFFSIKKNPDCVLIPRDSLEIFFDMCIFSSNMCNIVNEFFMNKLVLTNFSSLVQLMPVYYLLSSKLQVYLMNIYK